MRLSFCYGSSKYERLISQPFVSNCFLNFTEVLGCAAVNQSGFDQRVPFFSRPEWAFQCSVYCCRSPLSQPSFVFKVYHGLLLTIASRNDGLWRSQSQG